MRRKFLLFRHDDGAAVIELAIVLGLILLSAAAAMLLVGDRSQRSLALLTDWNMMEPHAAQKKAPAEIADDGENQQTAETAVAESGPQFITISHQALTAIFASVALVCYVALRRSRIQKLRAIEQLEEDRELVDRLDNKRFLKRQEILKVLAADPEALLENRIEVRHLMSTRLRTVRPKTTLAEMRAIMDQEHVRHFPVLTEKGRLVGIVSDRDLISGVARRAADVMTCSLITVSPTTRLGSAISQMVNRNISCLPVTEGEKLVGILTTTDAVMTLQCALHLWQRLHAPEAAGQPAMA